MKKLINFVGILNSKPHFLKLYLAILLNVGSYMLYAQPCVTEICNGIDDDCDGVIDEGVQKIFYNDYDFDSFYGYVTIVGCNAPPGWVEGDQGSCSDLNDYDNLIQCWDGWEEVCNGIDDDGNGLIDDADPGLWGAVYWYADSDGDGYGDSNASVYSCTQPSGYVPLINPYFNGYYFDYTDCDDSDPAINPGAEEICNGIDDNCDGVIDPENCNSIDTDCDGVPDDFDLCPGGDDSVDNNEDGIADCSQLLDFNDYSSEWHCGINKIFVCHNDNNPQTICIDANALLPAHFNHGDNIGPCTSCPQNLILPGNPGTATNTATAPALEVFPNRDGNKNIVVNNDDELLFRVVPNPADDLIEIQTSLTSGTLSVINISGKVVLYKSLSSHTNTVSTSSLMDGIYLIKLGNVTDCYIKRIVVIH